MASQVLPLLVPVPLVAAKASPASVAGPPRARPRPARHAPRQAVALLGAALTTPRWLKRRCAVRGGARRSQRRVASLDDVKTTSIRARKRPAAPVMSKRTLLRQAPSLEYLEIVAQMILDAELAPLVMCFQAWKQFLEEEAKEKEAEQRVKEVERQLKEVMVLRKQRVVKVFETMLRKQNEDMEFEIFQCWVQQCQEEKRAREMDDAMGHFTGKFSMLKTRQEQTALEVQSRINTQADNVLLSKFMSSWKQSSRAENLEKFFHRKLDNKRKQVAGVQTLFQTFAKQIEDNLDDEDDEEPGLETRRKARQAKGGMQRGGMAVSLPNIRKAS